MRKQYKVKKDNEIKLSSYLKKNNNELGENLRDNTFWRNK